MYRLFIDPRYIEANQVILVGDQLRKVRTVLRMEPPEPLIILDGSGTEYFCRITSISSRRGLLRIMGQSNESVEPVLKIHVGQAIPKSDKMAFIIQKAVELGVAAIHPFVSRRSVPRYDAGRQLKRLERWRKVALEAAQQSGRSLVPTVNEPVAFASMINRPFPNGASLMLHHEKSSRNLREILGEAKGKQSLFFLVGPEGGFDPEEVTLAYKQGFEPVNLGTRTLRTETAALAFLSIAQYEFGEIY